MEAINPLFLTFSSGYIKRLERGISEDIYQSLNGNLNLTDNREIVLLYLEPIQVLSI